jgi:hypothetical protein
MNLVSGTHLRTPSPAPRHHSSIVLSALLAEVEEGVKDELVGLSEEYRLKSEGVKTVALYRRNSIVNCDVTQGITRRVISRTMRDCSDADNRPDRSLACPQSTTLGIAESPT